MAVCQVANKKNSQRFTFDDEYFLSSCCRPLGKAIASLLNRIELETKEINKNEAVYFQESTTERNKKCKEDIEELKIIAEQAQREISELIEKCKEEKIQSVKLVAQLKNTDYISKEQEVISNALDQAEKEERIQTLLKNARRKWAKKCTRQYGPVGSMEVRYHRVDIDSMKRLLALDKSDIPSYESKIKWPPFRVLEQVIYRDIRRHLDDIESKRIQRDEVK